MRPARGGPAAPRSWPRRALRGIASIPSLLVHIVLVGLAAAFGSPVNAPRFVKHEDDVVQVEEEEK